MGAIKVCHFKSGLGLVYQTISRFSMDFFYKKYSARFYYLSPWRPQRCGTMRIDSWSIVPAWFQSAGRLAKFFTISGAYEQGQYELCEWFRAYAFCVCDECTSDGYILFHSASIWLRTFVRYKPYCGNRSAIILPSLWVTWLCGLPRGTFQMRPGNKTGTANKNAARQLNIGWKRKA